MRSFRFIVAHPGTGKPLKKPFVDGQQLAFDRRLLNSQSMGEMCG